MRGRDAFDIAGAACSACGGSVRNIGRAGLAATAISAVDAALWDLKAKLLDLPLATSAGRWPRPPCRSTAAAASPAIDDAPSARAARRLGGARRLPLGQNEDRQRSGPRSRRGSRRPRSAIGDAGLFVDANGALSPQAGLALAERCAERGCALVRGAGRRAMIWPACACCATARRPRSRSPPANMATNLDDFRRMLEAGAVDVLQADATRCGGITGFLQAAALCEAHHIDLSGHCAPSLCICHMRPAPCRACATSNSSTTTSGIEAMLFDGAPEPHDGTIAPDLSRPGLGLDIQDSATQSASASDEIMQLATYPDMALGSGLWPAVRGADAHCWRARSGGVSTDLRYRVRDRRSCATNQAAPTTEPRVVLAGGSVLADSAIEHYRGSFHNRAMYLPLAVSALTLAVSAHGMPREPRGADTAAARRLSLAASTAWRARVSCLYNVAKRPGGSAGRTCSTRAARRPGCAILLSGLLGSAAERVRDKPRGPPPTLFGVRPAGSLAGAQRRSASLGTAARRGCCISAAPSTTRRCCCRSRCRRSPRPLLNAAAASKRETGWLARWWLRLTVAGRVCRVGVPRLGHPAQHGRLAQLVAEPR